jgi:hypothetical protein
MIRLPRLSQGGIFDRDTFNRFVDAVEAGLRSTEIQPGIGYNLKRGPGGVCLDIASGFVSAPQKLPFDILTTSGTDGNPAINIWPGNVNGVMPDNMFDTFSVDDSSLYYIKATIITDGQAVTEVTLNVDTSTPDIQHSADGAQPSDFDILLGLYKNGMIYNIAGGNVTLTATQTFNLGYWAIS